MKQIKSRETEGLSKMSIQSLLIVLKKFFSEMPQKLVSYQVFISFFLKINLFFHLLFCGMIFFFLLWLFFSIF